MSTSERERGGLGRSSSGRCPATTYRLQLSSGDGKKAQLVDWAQLSGFGPDAIMVVDEDALRPPANDRERAATEGNLELVGKRALSERGNELGQIDDVTFDADTGVLEDLLIGDRRVSGRIFAGQRVLRCRARREPGALAVAFVPVPTGGPDRAAVNLAVEMARVRGTLNSQFHDARTSQAPRALLSVQTFRLSRPIVRDRGGQTHRPGDAHMICRRRTMRTLMRSITNPKSAAIAKTVAMTATEIAYVWDRK